MAETKLKPDTNIKYDQDRPCSWFDCDCYSMTFEQIMSCFLDAHNILKGGPADGYCPVLGEDIVKLWDIG